MTGLSLGQSQTIAAAALAFAREGGLAPLGIAVLDAGGHLVLALREDGASLFRVRIAQGKATGALGMGYGTRELARRAAAAPVFYNGLMALTGDVVPSPGGVLIRGGDGTLLGAIGISGDTGDHDEAAALAGIAGAGLVAQPGQ